MSEEKCNLTVYVEEKLKKTAYESFMDDARGLAKGIAKDMSDEDKQRLYDNPTEATLKAILDKNN